MGTSIRDLTAAQTEPRISIDLEANIVPVDALRPHPENPRRGDIEAIAASLARFGQVKPILALPDGLIVAGHHVYYAARSLGWDRVAAVRADLTPEQTRAYLLADNRVSDLGGYDPDALAAMLAEVAEFSEGLSGTGYTDSDLKRMLNQMERGRDPGDLGGGGPRDHDPIHCPNCGRPIS